MLLTKHTTRRHHIRTIQEDRQILLHIYPLGCNGEEEEACGPFADHECAVVRQAFKQQNQMVQKCQYCTIFMQLKS